jgi:hypothetical protein
MQMMPSTSWVTAACSFCEWIFMRDVLMIIIAMG